MKVTLYQRRPQGANFSVERLFTDVRRSLPYGIDTTVAVSRYVSSGCFRRIYNTIEAVFRQGDVNHITGDVHFIALLLRKRRTLLTILDLVSVHRLKGWRRALLLFLWYLLPIKRASVVSVISEFTKKDLLSHLNIDAKKIRVIHVCVSNDFTPTPRVFNATKPIILQIGTGPNKNLERVAEALREIPCHLRIIGKLNDQQLAKLSEHKIEYSSVFNITDEAIVTEYQQSDMLVFVSTYEGFGMPIIEANAVGRPVITGSVTSLPEVAGNAACIVDPYNVDEIRRGILRIITDDSYRIELVEKGFINAQRFQPANIAAQYVKIYEELSTKRFMTGCEYE